MTPRVILAYPEMIENFSLSTPTDKMLVQKSLTDKVKVRIAYRYQVPCFCLTINPLSWMHLCRFNNDSRNTVASTVYFIVLDPPMYTAVTEFDW